MKTLRKFALLALIACLLPLSAALAGGQPRLPLLPEPQALRLPGGLRLRVYEGPSESYHQADNGKAYASSNSPIEAFGLVGDWLLVRYRTTADHQRYGFISAQALDGAQPLAQLDLADQDGYALKTALMGDVLWRGEEIRPDGRLVKALSPLRLRARLGERFALAEVAGDSGQPRYALVALEAVRAADPRAQLNDKPVWWYGDFAPEAFWQGLDQTGYQQGLSEMMFARWGQAYGDDAAYWPLAQQAVSELVYVDHRDVREPMAGLPLEGDISQQEALEIARQAVAERHKEELAAAPLSDYEAAYGFRYNLPEPGGRCWQVWFVSPGERPEGLKFRVDVDAVTGEVLEVFMEEKGNG